MPSRAENLEAICSHCKNSRGCDTHNKVPCLGVHSDKQAGAVNDPGGAEVGVFKVLDLRVCVCKSAGMQREAPRTLSVQNLACWWRVTPSQTI